MAKKNENNFKPFESLELLAKEKGISSEVLLEKIKTAIEKAISKEHPGVKEIRYKFDREKDKMSVYIVKTVVEEVTDEANEISVEAAKGKSAKKPGDTVLVKVDTKAFTRIAATTAKQMIKSGIKEAERSRIVEKWGALENEIVSVTVVRTDPKGSFAIVELNGNEIPLSVKDMIPGETIRVGDIIKVHISGVSKDDHRPGLKLSRKNKEFVKRLFELEVPEIHDGTVEIKAISREEGSRSKVAVISHDPNVDALGACIGPNRARISQICKELSGEKIDVVLYSDDPKVFIAQALKPSDVISVEINEAPALDEADEAEEKKQDKKAEKKSCFVTVPDSQLSLAIGNKGQNAKLAAKLTGYKIDIKPESGFFESKSEEE